VSLVEVDNVTHRYSAAVARPVLDRVSLAISAGEVVSLVGESGCGKTTLGKVIAGLERPSSGRVRFAGRDIWSFRGKEAKAWRLSVQLVHQDPYASLNPGLTIGNTLGAGLIHNQLARHHDLQEHLVALLRQVGLDATPEFLRRYPHQLSGGQRQRVAIARAISVRPQLVVADEVTSMLDVSLRVSILDLLRSFSQERGVASLFISHDLGVVRYFGQGGRILVMFYGVVVEEGPTEEVIAHPGHPYTYLLLEAVPVPNPGLARQRAAARASEVLEGEPSTTGCVYSNRCPFAEAKCRKTRPEAVEVTVGHWVACYFPERVPVVGNVPPVGQASGGPVGVPSHEGRAKVVGGSASSVPGGGIASVDR
jgi:oligopeptide/dipeptide ABC transporter ATP-binding protein